DQQTGVGGAPASAAFVLELDGPADFMAARQQLGNEAFLDVFGCLVRARRAEFGGIASILSGCERAIGQLDIEGWIYKRHQKNHSYIGKKYVSGRGLPSFFHMTYTILPGPAKRSSGLTPGLF